MKERGISVSTPYGWGFDKDSNKVLLTSFAGIPILNIEQQQIKDLAIILYEIHTLSLYEIDESLHKAYNFIEYFYPRIMDFPDIHNVLFKLVQKAKFKQEKIIHGDFNLGNILENKGKYAVIDWTNAQLGDPRYDVAWSIFLIRIYNGEELYTVFLNTYSEKSGIPINEFNLFEAIACLRWVLLNRIADIPKKLHTIERVNNIIMNNSELNSDLIILQNPERLVDSLLIKRHESASC